MDYLTPNIPYSFTILAGLLDIFIVNKFVDKAEAKGEIDDLDEKDRKDYMLYKTILEDDLDQREKDLYIKPKLFTYLKVIIGIVVVPFLLSFFKGEGWL